MLATRAILLFFAGLGFVAVPASADEAVCRAHGGEWTANGVILSADRVPGSFYMMLEANVKAEPVGADVPEAAKAGDCLVGVAGGAPGTELPEVCAAGGKVTLTGDLYFDDPRYAGIHARKVVCE